MSNSTSSSSSSGIGFCGLLTILFIGLKLTGYIAWSWLWVLSPLWIGFLLFIAIIAIVVFGAGILALIAGVVSYFIDRFDGNKNKPTQLNLNRNRFR